MTVGSTPSSQGWNGDGSTVTFDITAFEYQQTTDVTLILRDAAGVETTWVEGTQYTLTLATESPPRRITVKTVPTDYTPAAGEKLFAIRSASETQATDLAVGGALQADSIETALDKAVMLVQQLTRKIGRAALLVTTTPTSGLVIPEPVADKVLGWNAGATNLENKDPAGTTPAQILTDLLTVDGAGSGLDADTVDGSHASAFATAAQGSTADAALPKAGGQMTGNITMAAAETVDGRDVSVDGARLDGMAENANNYAHPNHSGDVTSVGDGATTIAAGAVSLAKMAAMATASFLGRNTAATGDPEVLSATTARSILNVADGADVSPVSSVHTRTGAVVAVAGDYDGTAIDMQDSVLTRPNIKDYALTKKVATVHTGAVAVSHVDGNVYVDTGVTGNLTLSVTNWPASDLGKIDVWLKSDATGGWTITLTGFTWATTAASALTASKWTRFTLESPDGGTTKFASLIWEGK